MEVPIKEGNNPAHNEPKVDKTVGKVLSGPKIIEVEDQVKIVEGPIKGGNKPAQNESKTNKTMDKVLSRPKIIDVQDPVKKPSFSKVKGVDTSDKKN